MEEDEINETIEEARGSFNLTDRLMNRPMLHDVVTVFTDEVSGKKLGGSEVITNQFGVPTSTRRWGILGEIHELEQAPEEERDTKAIAKLKREAKALHATLDKSALTFTLRALPEIVVKDLRRKSKKSLKIKGAIPQERLEEFSEDFTARLLVDSVESFKDHESGETYSRISYNEARALDGFLPKSEYKKLDMALNDLQFKSQISEAVTADADF